MPEAVCALVAGYPGGVLFFSWGGHHNPGAWRAFAMGGLPLSHSTNTELGIALCLIRRHSSVAPVTTYEGVLPVFAARQL